MADVLLINLWYNDLGRYEGSNFGLLQVILESNLKLFGQSYKKKLVFVVRDFIAKGDNEQRSRDNIFKDIEKIWNEKIYKPEQHKNSLYSDFFEIEFCFLPNKIFVEEQFNEACLALKARLTKDTEGTLFPKKNNENNVPVDGLSYFIDQTWATIKDQKDLNLPDQREMVAEYRCNQIKDEAFEKVDEAVKTLEKESKSQLLQDFKQRSGRIIWECFDYYEAQASQYKSQVYEKIRGDMRKLIHQELFFACDAQVKLNTLITRKEFERAMGSLVKKDSINDKFSSESMSLLNRTLNCFKDFVKSVIVEDTNWEEMCQHHVFELQDSLERLRDQFKKEEIKKLRELTLNNIKETIDEIVNDPVCNLNDNFWAEVNKPLLKELKLVTEACSDILREGMDSGMEE
mmetsp:Transcript_14378/g.24485  ORF Transcript_14378/g.24485 Transcript_14378/m.24485 type:complete len:402 (+) Transcript_14378:377-1582(+)